MYKKNFTDLQQIAGRMTVVLVQSHLQLHKNNYLVWKQLPASDAVGNLFHSARLLLFAIQKEMKADGQDQELCTQLSQLCLLLLDLAAEESTMDLEYLKFRI